MSSRMNATFRLVVRQGFAGLGLLAILVVAVPAAEAACCRSPIGGASGCVDFEGMVVGYAWVVGDTFWDSGVAITVGQFQRGDGTWTTTGHAQADNAHIVDPVGQDMNISNANLHFDFGGPIEALNFRFANLGGNVNFEINGDFKNITSGNLGDLDGTTVGGVSIQVTGTSAGLLRAVGTISSFSVGGQELWIDDVCPEGECIDFEDLVYGTAYYFLDSLVDSGVTIHVDEFFLMPTGSTTGGTAIVSSGNAGASGLEMLVDNVNLVFNLPAGWQGLSFFFEEMGGNINMEVNGDFRNVNNFADLDGLVVGGALVSVTNGFGNDQGQVRILGPVATFSVGGQELYIDEVCRESGCVDFEDLNNGDSFVWGDVFTDSGATIEVVAFYDATGGPYTGGTCFIDNAQQAGGSGLEAFPGNTNLAVDFHTNYRALSMLYRETGGNVNLEVDGDFRNVDDFQDLHGLVVGGATVSVSFAADGRGVLELDGFMESFATGGQELWIDDICIDPIIFGDGFEKGNTSDWAVVVP